MRANIDTCPTGDRKSLVATKLADLRKVKFRLRYDSQSASIA
jgi:hypothetical protein